MLGRVSRILYSYSKISSNQQNFFNLQKCTTRYLQDSPKHCFCSQRLSGQSEKTGESDDSNLKSSMGDKYKVFKEEDSQEVFDVFEEKLRISLEELNSSMQEELDPYEGLDMTHGKDGVLELPTLVELLQREHAKNIFVAKVPKEYTYTDYIVIATSKNQRQMLACATFVRKAYKLLRYDNEPVPRIEGQNSADWMALDLGNVVLHLFSTSMREKYDLETLWSVGSQYDDITYFKEEVVDVFDKYKEFIRDLQPAE